MSVGILGNKIGMTQIFDEDGNVIPVTIVRVGPCVVTQIKTIERHGYNAIQIGYCQVPKRKLTKPEIGHLNKVNSPTLKYLKEFHVPSVEDFSIGQVIEVDETLIGTCVDVSGKSIGKGFAGNQNEIILEALWPVLKTRAQVLLVQVQRHLVFFQERKWLTVWYVNNHFKFTSC